MMNGQQPGQGPYTSGRSKQTPPTLSVNTSSPHHGRSQPAYQTPLSASSDVPTPQYPLPIPFDKREKALSLYIAYQKAEQAEQLAAGLALRGNDPASAIDGYLSVPGPSVPLSTASLGSPRRGRTPSISTYDPTEMSSVMSFEINESPSSATVDQKELKTFNGQTVKQRSRKKFQPAKKAKTALIRHLGSCVACRKRAVSCPLEHYDMSTLKRRHEAKLSVSKGDLRPELTQFPSSSSTTSRKYHRPPPGAPKEPRKNRRLVFNERAAPPTSQGDSLFLGLGQGPGLSEEYGQELQSNPEAYISQLDMDLPEELDGHILSPAPLYQAAQKLPAITRDSHSEDQDGTLILVGNFKNPYYHCRQDDCELLFQDVEELQSHFETTHFAYSRIHPPHRVLCSACHFMGNDMTDIQCGQCGNYTELCIYGRLMSIQSYGHYSSDEQEILQYTPTSTSHYALSHGSPSFLAYGNSEIHNNLQHDHLGGDYHLEFGQSYDYSRDGGHGSFHDPTSRHINDPGRSFGEEHVSPDVVFPPIVSPVWPSSVSGINGSVTTPGGYNNPNYQGTLTNGPVGLKRSDTSVQGESGRQESMASPEQLTNASLSLAHLLAANVYLRPLLISIGTKFGHTGLMASLSNLLKLYFAELQSNALNDNQGVAANFFGQQVNRTRIVEYISKDLMLDHDFNNSLPQKSHEPLAIDTIDMVPGFDASDDGSEPVLTRLPCPFDFSQNHTFFIDASRDGSLRNLEIRMRLLLLPAALRPVTRTLLSLPPESLISFSSEADRSMPDHIKCVLENVSGGPWNWWPLQPCVRPVEYRHTRVHWICHCGTPQWSDIPDSTVDDFKVLVIRRAPGVTTNHLCKGRTLEPAGSLLDRIKRLAGSRSPSHFPGNSSGNIPSTNIPLASLSSIRINDMSITRGSDQNSEPVSISGTIPHGTSSGGVEVAINRRQLGELFVLFGVKGRRQTLELAQLNVSDYANDSMFFQALSSEYKNLRGFLRYWLSIWQLQHCDFVKFKKVAPNRVIFHEMELPVDMMYEYKPRPPEAEVPPILPQVRARTQCMCHTLSASVPAFS